MDYDNDQLAKVHAQGELEFCTQGSLFEESFGNDDLAEINRVLVLPPLDIEYENRQSADGLEKILSSRKVAIEFTPGQVEVLDYSERLRSMAKDGYELAPFVVSGYAGTGKTTILENVFTRASETHTTTLFLAPTNRAIRIARSKIPGLNSHNSRTIHSLLYGRPINGEFKTKFVNPLSGVQLAIIDESSMLSRKMIDDLILFAKTSRTQLIFLGDNFQLPPVEDSKGGPTQAILTKPHIELVEVRRQSANSPVLACATLCRVEEKIVFPERSMPNFKVVPGYATDIQIASEYVRRMSYDSTNGDVVCIVAKNESRVRINNEIRKLLYGGKSNYKIIDSLPHAKEKLIAISNGQAHTNGSAFKVQKSEFLATAQVELPNNSSDGRIWYSKERFWAFNIVDEFDQEFTALLFPETRRASIHLEEVQKSLAKQESSLSKLFEDKNPTDDVVIATYGYAMSCHKSQGGQWHTALVLPEGEFGMNPRWFYTAITRASKSIVLYSDLYSGNDSTDSVLMLSPNELSTRWKNILGN